ncbi:MAG: alkaline phosphatase [Sphingobacteriales bacterium]|nr:alkaline phosphatase [Sphingobacteriales bacterium]OJY86213.1 MAG: alkaline phosphatase [Sphingobacteriales bacterium 44-15]
MQRRDFFRNGSLAFLGSTLLGQNQLQASAVPAKGLKRKARNIIFMVSDGMSTGTLNMADLLLQRKEGRRSTWLSLYDGQTISRALMDTASASSLVTDSAAGSSSWGGGVRVKNGSLNVNADGSVNIPILQKFKNKGKSVGCVTTVPITHATPAGFCITNNKRGDMDEIALQYLPLRFDVMMGGGIDNFMAATRKDKRDLIKDYRQADYTVVTGRNDLLRIKPSGGNPLLGLFYDSGLPYSLDRAQNQALSEAVPTLAEMTQKAIEVLNNNKQGFALQVEGGKVDWAAHANDVGALLYDQIAFDDAVKVAVDFAKKDKETLVVITTDHGNANPGIFYGDAADKNFDNIQKFRQTNDWILNGINRNFTVEQVIERVEYAQGMILKKDEASELLNHYTRLDEAGIYNPRKLPFQYLADIQRNYTSVGWGSMDHSGDYVELSMYGPGSELLNPFVKNTDLHYLMLEAAGMEVKK